MIHWVEKTNFTANFIAKNNCTKPHNVSKSKISEFLLSKIFSQNWSQTWFVSTHKGQKYTSACKCNFFCVFALNCNSWISLLRLSCLCLNGNVHKSYQALNLANSEFTKSYSYIKVDVVQTQFINVIYKHKLPRLPQTFHSRTMNQWACWGEKIRRNKT